MRSLKVSAQTLNQHIIKIIKPMPNTHEVYCYIKPEHAQKLASYCQKHNLSHSDAVGSIIGQFFDQVPSVKQSSTAQADEIMRHSQDTLPSTAWRK